MVASSGAALDEHSQPRLSGHASLRMMLDARRDEQSVLTLGEAAALIVPLCLDLQERHGRGEKVFVHPSCVEPRSNGLVRFLPDLSMQLDNPKDRACIPPELVASRQPGGPRSSVFSIGAILYECVTGTVIGPGMQRPREVNPKLPEALEVLLSKALVSNPANRPDDLGALASALHNLAPKQSIHPPDVDEGRLDHGDDFEVDIKLSMLPPVPQPAPAAPTRGVSPAPGAVRLDEYGQVAAPISAPRPSGPKLVERLAILKNRLESDPRPRYVVHKDYMDHGPFSAVELLQQIASNGFVAGDHLRDELSGQQRPIAEWEEFAPFAEQAALKRDVIEENRVVAQVAKAEKKAGVAKSTIGILVVVGLAAFAALWFVKVRGSRNDDVQVQNDSTLDLNVQGGIKGQKRANKGGGGGGGRGGGGGGGMSYDQAMAQNPQQIDMSGRPQSPDLTNDQLSGPLQNGAFLNTCGVPNSMHVQINAVVKMGHAIGVSVSTNPPNGGIAACIDRSVRNIAWPVSSKADGVHTSY
jgi:hypothetical protein